MRFYPSFYSGNFFSEFLKNTLRNDALLWGLENNVNLDDVALENYLGTTTSSESITDTLNDLTILETERPVISIAKGLQKFPYPVSDEFGFDVGSGNTSQGWVRVTIFGFLLCKY